MSKIRALLAPLLGGALFGCAGEEPNSDPTIETVPETGPTPNCAYPEGAVEPMALGSVISPYRWPIAIHRDGRPEQPNLRLANVPCESDEEIDWSPFEALLFVSIPAW